MIEFSLKKKCIKLLHIELESCLVWHIAFNITIHTSTFDYFIDIVINYIIIVIVNYITNIALYRNIDFQFQYQCCFFFLSFELFSSCFGSILQHSMQVQKKNKRLWKEKCNKLFLIKFCLNSLLITDKTESTRKEKNILF